MSATPTPGSSPLLEVRDLAVSYGGVVQALRGVSLTVDEGAVVALLGSNGAGKTTLLRALSGTLRLHRGRVEGGDVLYQGESLEGRDPARCVASGLVQVPEGRRIFTRLTVEENLKAGGLAVRDRRRTVRRLPAHLRHVPGPRGPTLPAGRPALRRRAADAGDGPRR